MAGTDILATVPDYTADALTAAWGLLILFAWLALALFAPWIAPYDPIAQDTGMSLLAPSLAHPLGTDNYGRDILSRVIWGARIDLQLAVVGVIFPFIIGTFIGAVSGYIGGRFDSVCMRVIDVVLAFPFLVLMLAIMAILGPGLQSFYIAMALVGWVSYARALNELPVAIFTLHFDHRHAFAGQRFAQRSGFCRYRRGPGHIGCTDT